MDMPTTTGPNDNASESTMVQIEVSDTALGEALCSLAIAHTGQAAYCLRHHPQDTKAILKMSKEAFLRATTQLENWLEKLPVAGLGLGHASAPHVQDARAFRLEGTWECVNLVRRAWMTLPWVLACVEVQVLENGGLDSDEIVTHRLGFVILQLDDSITPESQPHGLLATIGPIRPSKGPRHVYASDLRGLPGGAKVASPQMLLQVVPIGGGFWMKLHFAWKRSGTHARHQAVAVPAVWPEIQVTRAQLDTLCSHGYQAENEKERELYFGFVSADDQDVSLKRRLCKSMVTLALSRPAPPLTSEDAPKPPHPYWRCRAEVVREQLTDLAWTPWPPEKATCTAVIEVESLGQRSVSTHWRHLRVQMKNSLCQLRRLVKT